MLRPFTLRLLASSMLAVAICPAIGCYDAPPARSDVQTGGETYEVRGGFRFVRGLEAGQRLAARLQAPALVFFTAPWCTYCHRMEATAMRAPGPTALAERFVCIVVDADSDPEACRRMHVRGFPTIQFLSPGGAPLNQLVGQQSAETLTEAMNSALDRVAWRQSSERLAR